MTSAFIPGDVQSHTVPTYEVPISDKHGKMHRSWYRFMQNLSDIPLYSACTVAKLPAPPAKQAGARGFVTDATATTFLSVPVGNGTHAVPVVWSGSGWLIG